MVSWGSATNATSYLLERQVNGGSWTQIANQTGLTYTEQAQPSWDTVTYRVRAYHSSGGYSGYRTSETITILHNKPPVITDSDRDLGVMDDSFEIAFPPYQVSDPDAGDIVEVEERLDGKLLRAAFVAAQNVDYTPTIAPAQYLKVLNGTHTLTIKATDSGGKSATRTWTFTKRVTVAEVRMTIPLEADEMPTALRLSLQGMFPDGCARQVKICNNGNDEEPEWEDRTAQYLAKQQILFQNTEKTAAQWGIRLWVKLERQAAVGDCYLVSKGGTFR